MNSWQRSEMFDENVKLALNIIGLILLVGGWFTMLLLWFLGVI